MNLKVNGGFSAGKNISLLYGKADNYLLLNGDAYVRKGAVPFMISTASREAYIGIEDLRLEWPDGCQRVSLSHNSTLLNSFYRVLK